MKLTFSNLLALSSILVWAAAWMATEKHATANAKEIFSPTVNSHILLQVDGNAESLMLSR